MSKITISPWFRITRPLHHKVLSKLRSFFHSSDLLNSCQVWKCTSKMSGLWRTSWIFIPVQVTVQYNKPSNKIQANFKLYLIRHCSCVTCTRKHLDYIATRILNYATIAGLQNVLSNTVTLCKLTDKPHLNQNI